MTWGTRLRKHREKKRLSQKEVAEHLGVSQTTYCNWEMDVSSFQMKHLYQLTKLFDVTILELMPEEINIKLMNNKVTLGRERTENAAYLFADLIKSKEEIIQLLKDENTQLKARIMQLEKR